MNSRPDSGNFGKALVLIAVVAGGWFVYDRWYSPDSASAPEARRKSAPVAEIAKASSGSAQDPDLGGLPVIATVYECKGPEGRVLSDKPCADDAQLRQVREPNRMDGTPAAQPASTCAQLDENIRLVSERLRDTNLPADLEKEHRQRLREYRETRRELKCR